MNPPVFGHDFWASVERRSREAKAAARAEIGELERRLAAEDEEAEASEQGIDGLLVTAASGEGEETWEAMVGLQSKESRPKGLGLTATERRVAEMVASGLTNREVAAQLFISPKTVEANLSKIYSKYGVRSRTELATRMAERVELPGRV